MEKLTKDLCMLYEMDPEAAWNMVHEIVESYWEIEGDDKQRCELLNDFSHLGPNSLAFKTSLERFLATHEKKDPLQ
mgnify:FL=1